ncbi:MAG: adenylate/guanylate cyclase domain-containing protein [Thermoleophilaceae bacterium]|nr:adenylate/guanylate cyclase domain-containing protein [Thermoleophilaceae bacterium]
MNSTRSTSTADLLLEVMELTSLGASTESQLSRRLRRSHPFARADRRLGGVLKVLEAEGLIVASPERGERAYRTTPNGLEALEKKGRFSATAAVLFTDIVGSTELIDSLGETEAHEIRQRHFALLRQAVDSCRGQEVKSLGDGLMVIFGKPASAAECASTMQQLVADGADQIGLRVGVHAGELLRDGDDYFGSTVITARRLCDLADSGQTLISDDTFALLGGKFGHSAESVGALELKGLSVPVPASALNWGSPVADLVA